MNRRRFVLFFMILLIPLLAFAESAAKERLEWLSDENALEYTVEVRNKASGSVRSFTTQNNFIEISERPGNYEFRVKATDVLGRESSVSEWQEFRVSKAMTPVVSKAPSSGIQVPEAAESSMSIPVEIQNVQPRTTVQLVNSATNQVVQGELVTTTLADGTTVATAINAPVLESGKWKIKVTDPSGRTAETKDIKVDNPWPEIRAKQERELALKAEEERRQAEEAIRKAEEESRRAEEERIRQEQERLKREYEERRKSISERQAEIERQIASSMHDYLSGNNKKAVEKKKMEIIFSAGLSSAISLHDSGLLQNIKYPLFTELRANISFMPAKVWLLKVGGEVSLDATFVAENENKHPGKYTINKLNPLNNVGFARLVFDGAARYEIPASDFSACAKLGLGGVFTDNKSLGLEKELDDSFYICLHTANSIFLFTQKSKSLELGLDYNHIFVPDYQTDILSLYFNLGFYF